MYIHFFVNEVPFDYTIGNAFLLPANRRTIGFYNQILVNRFMYAAEAMVERLLIFSYTNHCNHCQRGALQRWALKEIGYLLTKIYVSIKPRSVSNRHKKLSLINLVHVSAVP